MGQCGGLLGFCEGRPEIGGAEEGVQICFGEFAAFGGDEALGGFEGAFLLGGGGGGAVFSSWGHVLCGLVGASFVGLVVEF